jgi:hypothetical protein
MMRFMMTVKVDENGGPPTLELGAAIGQLTQEMVVATDRSEAYTYCGALIN